MWDMKGGIADNQGNGYCFKKKKKTESLKNVTLSKPEELTMLASIILDKHIKGKSLAINAHTKRALIAIL